jgi:hypothetical protein
MMAGKKAAAAVTPAALQRKSRREEARRQFLPGSMFAVVFIRVIAIYLFFSRRHFCLPHSGIRVRRTKQG